MSLRYLRGGSFLFSIALIAGMAFGALTNQPLVRGALAASFNPNNLIDDATFQARDAMSSADIQAFLARKGSGLANYSENGRSAAQIIYDAAHGAGEASGTFAGRNIVSRINPQVLLVTLQKEQGLITEANPSNAKLECAMGYGVNDSTGCVKALNAHPSWRGFTKQVEFAAWQLQWNYERSVLSQFNDFKAGGQQTFNDYNGAHSVTFNNQATAALYRYTPHVYNGNYNFFTFMQQYFNSLAAAWAGQSNYPTLDPGQPGRFWVRFKNVGTETWTRDSVRLGTSNPKDRVPGFIREDTLEGNTSGWISSNRVAMQESSVPPGEAATFVFYLTPPSDAKSGLYREYFQPLGEGVGWMQDYGVYWDVRVREGNNGLTAHWASQNAYPTARRGESFNLQVTFKNTGTVTWKQNEVFLATRNEVVPPYIREDRQSGNTSGWVSATRVQMNESSVAPGQTATFSFWMTVTADKEFRAHRESFRMITASGTWFPDLGVYWDVNVIQ